MIRRIVDRLARSFGFELVRQGWEHRRLAKDFRVNTIIDVGVGVGEGTPALYMAFPEATLLLVEPNPASWPFMDKILETRSGVGVRLAAGSEAGELDLHTYPDAPEISSAFLRDQFEELDVEVRTVGVQSLDHIVRSSKLQGPYGLKIDVEGFEFEVLRGSTEMLKETEFVVFESQIQTLRPRPYSQGQICGFMEEQGFHLYDIVWVAYDHASMRTLQADLLFRREG